MKLQMLAILLTTVIANPLCFAQDKAIALTIDDLPFVGTNSATKGNLGRAHDRFTKILNFLIDAHIPATGFIIANSIATGQWALLEEFRNAGFGLGNHTYSHANLNHMSAEKYISDIQHAEKIIAPIMTQPKYFRYPYLAEGRGTTKQAVQDYLVENQYIIAPVTIDSKDYQYNERLLHISWRVRMQHINQIKQQYLAYIWQQTLKAEKRDKDGTSMQILLIHSNLLNSHCLGDVIQMYKEHGYRFVTLEEALAHQKTTPVINETTDVSDRPKVSINE